jgi:hypothetical protein
MVYQGSIQEIVCGMSMRAHLTALEYWVCRSSILSVDMILPWWNRLRDFSLPGDDLLSQTPLLWMSPMFQVYLTPIYLNC